MSEDFYEVLGVDRDADEDEIRSAFREKAAEYHPDVSDHPDAQEKFKQVKKAKEVLGEEETRRAYDRLGHERFEQAEKRGGFDGGGGAGGDPFGGGSTFTGGGPFGDMGDLFDQVFGGGRSRQRGPRQGADLRTAIEIDLEEAYDGVTKQLTITRPERCDTCQGRGHPPDADPRTCPQCDGQGQVTRVRQTPLGRVQQTQTCGHCGGAGELYERTCDDCGGEGVVRNEATLSVDVPPGIRDGQSLRVGGEGAPGEQGGPNGDLLIELSIRPHDEFERDGDDIYYRLPISFPQAVFGDTVQVPTLDGGVEFDVPSATQSGERFRLRGKGMPRLNGAGNGDQYVQVQLVTPDSLSADEREALEAFAEAGGEDIDVEQGFFERIKSSF